MSAFQNQHPIYIFLTGGYDSIFRFCQLAMSRIPVRGIYLNLPNVDGTPGHRRNAKYELDAIQYTVGELVKMGYGQYIHTIKIITSVTIPPKVREICRRFYESGLWARPVTQYVYMISLSLQLNKVIETGVLCDRNAVIYKTIGKYINPLTQMIDAERVEEDQKYDLMIFMNLRFPLCGTTKSQMLTYAKKNGFVHILKKTISCWYPDNNGNPCGHCNMCNERIKMD
jgi:hypothetical protein